MAYESFFYACRIGNTSIAERIYQDYPRFLPRVNYFHNEVRSSMLEILHRGDVDTLKYIKTKFSEPGTV